MRVKNSQQRKWQADDRLNVETTVVVLGLKGHYLTRIMPGTARKGIMENLSVFLQKKVIGFIYSLNLINETILRSK